MSDQQPAGRRAAVVAASRRRIGPAVVLAVVLPLATLGAAMLVRTEAPAVPDTPPETVPLTRLTLACPSSQDAGHPEHHRRQRARDGGWRGVGRHPRRQPRARCRSLPAS